MEMIELPQVKPDFGDSKSFLGIEGFRRNAGSARLRYVQ